MRKAVLTLLIAVTALAARAYDYPYLAFETTGGEVTTVAVESLSLAIADGSLVATNAEGTHTFALSELSSMRFCVSPTSVAATDIDFNSEVQVVSVSGIEFGRFANIDEARKALPAGVYLMKSNKQTLKIAIR